MGLKEALKQIKRKEDKMSWYSITYACGHTDREQIYGPTRERQNEADWIGNNKVCKPCWIRGRAEVDRKAALERAGLQHGEIMSPLQEEGKNV